LFALVFIEKLLYFILSYDVNNNNINQQQQQVEQNMIQTDTNNDQQTENTGVQQADYGEVDYNQNDNVDNTDYDNACEDYTTEEEDYIQIMIMHVKITQLKKKTIIVLKITAVAVILEVELNDILLSCILFSI